MIWWLAGLMALIVFVALLWPLGARRPVPSGRAAKAMAIYEDQLAELERDQNRGLITAAEAKAAQVEIKRRMLAAGQDEPAIKSSSGRKTVLIAALFVPIAGFALYDQVGAPDVPAVPFSERSDEQRDARELQTLLTELRFRLESDPNGGETQGWTLLASTLMNQNRYAEAAEAYAVLTERPEATSATFSQYAEALILAENGAVTPRAANAIARSAELDPLNPAASYYRAVELDQAGETAQARAVLLDRVRQETRPAPWMGTFVNLANQMGTKLDLPSVDMPRFETQGGPSASDVEAASEMSEEDRAAFIRSMVDSLEARLQEEPENLDGWLQLARSLLVLNEEERALKALRSAAPLVQDLPEDDPRRVTVETGLARLGGG
ncbi:MAG: c-type cytochrome biogenesis protein CcmI [Pseudomonadota bacterium]